MAAGSLSRLAQAYSPMAVHAIENPLPGESPPCGLSVGTAGMLLRVLHSEGNAARCRRMSDERASSPRGSSDGPARRLHRR